MNPVLLLLFIPVVIAAVFVKWKYHDRIHWGEFALQMVVPIILILMVWAISTSSMTSDTETINGRVTGKEQSWTSCEHSYSCNCRTVTTGSGKTRSSHTVCDTCYEHSNDWDWDVKSTVGSFTIDRIDRRGTYEPPRWTAVKLNDPVALPHGYTNYVKGAPDSLFHAIGTYKDALPEYPGYYDYQYSDRVIGVPPQYARRWNGILAESLKNLGAERQVNFVLVVTDKSPLFANALRSKWLGGKKNDIVVVVGSKKYPYIDWVRVFSWSKRDLVNVRLRNALLESRVLQSNKTIGIIAKVAKDEYVRRPMEDFAYLKNDIKPSAWVMVLALILGTIASIGIAIWSHNNDWE